MRHLAAVYALTGPAIGAFWFVFAAKFAGVRLARGRRLAVALACIALALMVAAAVDPALTTCWATTLRRSPSRT